jgi:hypothetical protein
MEGSGSVPVTNGLDLGDLKTHGSGSEKPVFRIRIHRIHMFLGHKDPDPLVRGMDPDPAPDPSIIKQK